MALAYVYTRLKQNTSALTVHKNYLRNLFERHSALAMDKIQQHGLVLDLFDEFLQTSILTNNVPMAEQLLGGFAPKASLLIPLIRNKIEDDASVSDEIASLLINQEDITEDMFYDLAAACGDDLEKLEQLIGLMVGSRHASRVYTRIYRECVRDGRFNIPGSFNRRLENLLRQYVPTEERVVVDRRAAYAAIAPARGAAAAAAAASGGGGGGGGAAGGVVYDVDSFLFSDGAYDAYAAIEQERAAIARAVREIEQEIEQERARAACAAAVAAVAAAAPPTYGGAWPFPSGVIVRAREMEPEPPAYGGAGGGGGRSVPDGLFLPSGAYDAYAAIARAREMEQARARVAAAVPPAYGHAFEVHDYSDKGVTVTVNGRRYTGKTNDVAIQYVEHRLPEIPDYARDTALSFQTAWLGFGSWVEEKYRDNPAKKAKALRALENIKGDDEGRNEASEAFIPVKIWYFVNTFHNSHVDAWMDCFIEESITAYEGTGGRLSCTKGIKERVCLGMRAVDDETLHQIFGSAEAGQLLKVFLAGCNFGDDEHPEKARFVANGLKARGITQKSTEEEAKVAMRSFMEEGIRSNGGDLADKADEINAMVELVEYGFEYYLKPHLPA